MVINQNHTSLGGKIKDLSVEKTETKVAKKKFAVQLRAIDVSKVSESASRKSIRG